MNPKSEQEIYDLLISGQISQQQAQMFRMNLQNSQSPLFGDVLSTPQYNQKPTFINPTMSTPSGFPSNTSEAGSMGSPINGQSNVMGDIWGTSSQFPNNQTQPNSGQFPLTQEDYNAQVGPWNSPLGMPNATTSQKRSMQDFATEQEWVTYSLENALSSPDTARMNWRDWKNANSGSEMSNKGGGNRFPLIYPGGSDLSTELYSLGRGIGAPKGSTGRGATIVGAAGSALFDISRNIAAGIGYEKMNNYVDQWYRDQQFGGDSKNYVAAPQYQNNNYTGGFYGENGGEVEMVSQENPQEGQQALQQMASQVTQALQQGQTPQEIVQALVQNGMNPQQAQQLVQAVVQNLQQASTQGQPSLENQENMDNLQASEQVPMMKNGGTFKNKVGDTITFTHNQEKITGKIKEIKNGRIYL